MSNKLSKLASRFDHLLKTSNEEDFVENHTAVNQAYEKCRDAALKSDWFSMGWACAELDAAEGNPYINGAESIRLIKYFNDPVLSKIRIPLSEWTNYTRGYCAGAGKSDADTEKDLAFTTQILSKLK